MVPRELRCINPQPLKRHLGIGPSDQLMLVGAGVVRRGASWTCRQGLCCEEAEIYVDNETPQLSPALLGQAATCNSPTRRFFIPTICASDAPRSQRPRCAVFEVKGSHGKCTCLACCGDRAHVLLGRRHGWGRGMNRREQDG